MGDFLFASFTSLFLFKVGQRISSFYKASIIKYSAAILLNIQTNCLKDIATDSGHWQTSYSATAIDDFVFSMGTAYAQTHKSDAQPLTESQ